MKNCRLWLVVGVLLVASCSGGGSTGQPWPPATPRQPERLALVAPNEPDGIIWWQKNIFLGLANSGGQNQQQTEYVQALLAQTNVVRQANGLAPVELLGSLNAAAQAHALDQATRDYWAHQTPEGLTSRERVAAVSGLKVIAGGENSSIGVTGIETAESMVWGWEHHAGHRELLLNPDVRYMGGGWARYSASEPLFVTQVLVGFGAE